MLTRTSKIIGIIILFIGLASIVIDAFSLWPAFEQVLHQWDNRTAWAIKLGMVLAGVAMFMVACAEENQD